ncbi:Crp/Fnr family transcriptional regulator [Sphingomonas swuensis]|uniref:Crp/Fnr family transcriptional regulator n=1 Tax=Sphingomonas swuensis TaxID=977800 RepID=A0ABP7SZW8_9SPHN
MTAVIAGARIDGAQLLVDKLSSRHPLDEEDRDALRNLPCTVQVANPNQYLIHEGQLAGRCSFLLSGFAIRYKIVAGDRRQIVAILIRGDFVDLQNSMLGFADHSVQMLTRGKIASVSSRNLWALVRARTNIAEALWFDTSLDTAVLHEWLASLGRRDARSRIAHLLCEFAVRMKVAGLATGVECGLPMSQEQLADTIGLAPAYVNRTLKQLEDDGLIYRVTPRSITIADWDELSEVGDFTSDYLHLAAEDA